MIHVELAKPDFIGKVELPDTMDLKAIRYSTMDKGWYDRAEIEVSARDKKDLKSVARFLRYGVNMTNENGTLTWAGIVTRVEITIKNVTIAYDLEDMYNSVSLAYTLSGFGSELIGERGDSTTVIDGASQARFGIKELLETGGNMSATAADVFARRLLNDVKSVRPQPTVGGYSKDGAKLICKGLWHTLSWRMSKVAAKVALSYTTMGNAGIGLNAAGRTAMAEPFQPAADINLLGVKLYLKRTGTPGNLNVQITEWDENELPGVVVVSANKDFAQIGTAYSWIDIALSSTLTMGKKYYLVASVSSGDADNYFTFLADGMNGYGYGEFKTKTGSAWSTEPYDIPFMIFDNQLIETTQQIKNHLEAFGQFLRTVRIQTNSGVPSESYRNGDTTALDEVQELLEIGTNTYNPLCAKVFPDRSVMIFERPPATTVQYELREDGKLYYRGGDPVEPDLCLCGVWMSIDPILEGIDTAAQGTVKNVCWIEKAEYDAVSGEVVYIPTGYTNPLARELKATVRG